MNDKNKYTIDEKITIEVKRVNSRNTDLNKENENKEFLNISDLNVEVLCSPTNSNINNKLSYLDMIKGKEK